MKNGKLCGRTNDNHCVSLPMQSLGLNLLSFSRNITESRFFIRFDIYYYTLCTPTIYHVLHNAIMIHDWCFLCSAQESAHNIVYLEVLVKLLTGNKYVDWTLCLLHWRSVREKPITTVESMCSLPWNKNYTKRSIRRKCNKALALIFFITSL